MSGDAGHAFWNYHFACDAYTVHERLVVNARHGVRNSHRRDFRTTVESLVFYLSHTVWYDDVALEVRTTVESKVAYFVDCRRYIDRLQTGAVFESRTGYRSDTFWQRQTLDRRSTECRMLDGLDGRRERHRNKLSVVTERCRADGCDGVRNILVGDF